MARGLLCVYKVTLPRKCHSSCFNDASLNVTVGASLFKSNRKK